MLARLATDPGFAARVAADPAAALADLRLSATDLAAVEAVVAPPVADPLSESGTRLRWLLEGADTGGGGGGSAGGSTGEPGSSGESGEFGDGDRLEEG